jgi:hypothetical protein
MKKKNRSPDDGPFSKLRVVTSLTTVILKPIAVITSHVTNSKVIIKVKGMFDIHK